MDTADPDKDLILFGRIARGDEKAFEEVFRYYTVWLYPSVFSFLRSEAEAREVIQDVFLKLWLHREELHLVLNPAGWMHRVAANLCLTRLRSRAREYRRMQVVASETSASVDDGGHLLDVKELNGFVREAVERLPASRREVFELSREQGLTRREIAERLGISENTVRNQLAAALRFVQAYLEGKTGLMIPACILFWDVLKNM